MNVLVIGGAGYVGTVLVNELLDLGHNVTSYDLMMYGEHFNLNKNLRSIKGDIRDLENLEKYVQNQDCIVHLACISNDPSFELNPILGKSINFDCFEPLVEIAKRNSVKKFIYASSSSVYGVKNEKNVTEDKSLEPLTDYSKFKVLCEQVLLRYRSDEFETVVIRPATVCGYSPRQRLDVVVNIFANFAYFKNKIQIFGGKQLRPNINIKDMCLAYLKILDEDGVNINGEIYNVGQENHSLNQLAMITKKVINENILIENLNSNDNRSYHISSKKIFEKLNFKPTYDIEDATLSLKNAFDKKILTNTFDNIDYFNIKKMQSINLK